MNIIRTTLSIPIIIFLFLDRKSSEKSADSSSYSSTKSSILKLLICFLFPEPLVTLLSDGLLVLIILSVLCFILDSETSVLLLFSDSDFTVFSCSDSTLSFSVSILSSVSGLIFSLLVLEGSDLLFLFLCLVSLKAL